MNASYNASTSTPVATGQPKPGAGPAGIAPKMLEELARAAARGRLGDQHMRAFAELCRTRPEARDMYQRELALINMQNGQQQTALGNRPNTGLNPPAQPQPSQQQQQQQQAQPVPPTNPSTSPAGTGNASLAQIAQIGPEQLLELNIMLSKQMAESSACQQQASNPSLSQKEREALLAKAVETRNRIMPIANLLNKTGLYKNVDTSTPQAKEAAIETMRVVLTRYKAAMAAHQQQGRTDSPASTSTSVAQPASFGSPSQSPNPNAAGRQVAPLPQQARQTRAGATAGPPGTAASSAQPKVNLPPAIQNQYSAIAQQQQQHSQQTNQQAQAALTAAAAAAAAASAAAAANAGAPSSAQAPTPQPSVTPTPTSGPTTMMMNRTGSQDRAAFPAPRASLTGGHAHGASMSAGAVYKPPTNGVVDALSGHAAAGGGVGGGGPGGVVGGAGPSDGGGQGGVRDGGARPAGVGDREAGRVVTKRKVQELVESIDPNERLDPEVEDMFLEIADEFIDSVTRFGCQLAKHRKSERLECKDIQLHLERAWNIRIPGFANDEIRQSQSRRVNAAPAYQARVASVREELKRRRGGA